MKVAAISVPCEEAERSSYQWDSFAIALPTLLFPNALWAISLITEYIGCNSCYSFIHLFMLSSYQCILASAFQGLPYNYF